MNQIELELKNTLTALKKFTRGIQRRLEEAEERMRKVEDWSFEMIESEKQKKKE